MPAIDRARLTALLDQERARHRERTPASREAFEAAGHLFGGVPMTWMNKWSGGYPLYLARAHGNRIEDVDGNEYIDFALGDTGAMAGHSPAATVEAVTHRIGVDGGITTMMPSADAEWVAAELSRRFGLPLWSYSLSATDANRWALRIARMVTGRPMVAAFSYCYHGSVDETFVVTTPDGGTAPRGGNVGPAVPVAQTTRAMEFNDLASVEAALAPGDVAVLAMEPALTNIGIVLPEPGFLEGVRELCTRFGTLLLIDETHTISSGRGGYTRTHDLDPDIFVVGKCVAGGMPTAAWGLRPALAERLATHRAAAEPGFSGMGTTLSANPMQFACLEATLSDVMTEMAYARMEKGAARLERGLAQSIARHGAPWHVVRVGARVEFICAPGPLRNGSEAAAAHAPALEAAIHMGLLNRGSLIAPFHNMMLVSPATKKKQIDRLIASFDEICAVLFD